MRRLVFVAGLILAPVAAQAQLTATPLTGLSAASSVSGADLFPLYNGACPDFLCKATATAMKIFVGSFTPVGQTGNYTTVSTDTQTTQHFRCSSNCTETLPASSGLSPTWTQCVVNSSGTATLTLTPVSGTIANVASVTLSAGQGVCFDVDASLTTNYALIAGTGAAGSPGTVSSATVGQIALYQASGNVVSGGSLSGGTGVTCAYAAGAYTCGLNGSLGTVTGYHGLIQYDATIARTFTDNDCGSTWEFTSSSAITVTLANSALAACDIRVIQKGAGQVTFTAASGATLASFGGFTKSAGANAAVTALVDQNSGGTSASWILAGAIGP